jgi:outer membrane protein OmpA-like peptidoglycan-associated protein
MRSIIFKAACVAAILSSPLIACSQHYYVVVGSFATNDDASEFKGYLPDQYMDTSYTVSENDNLLRFYVLKTSDKESAVTKTLELQKTIESWKPEERPAVSLRAEGMISGNIPIRPSVSKGEEIIAENSAASGNSSTVTASAGGIPPKPVGKYFKFQIESPEGLPVHAKVHHVDFENGREVAAYDANTFVDLLRPGDNSKPMSLVCGLFGYKEIHKYVDYADPSMTDAEAYVDPRGAWVIPYKLERVEKGDVSVMYNVSFYKDAAIMRKSSVVDLGELVKMMHSNPYYEITIHSYCNGKNKREIIAPGPDKNYFDAMGSVKINGSARDLTTLRAEAIRGYLAENGVDQERVKIFSWGGSDMLVKADSPEASVNDRIEIEFTRD